MEKQSVKVGLLGLGTVGTGVYRVLTGNAGCVGRKVGLPIEIKKVVDKNPARGEALGLPEGVFSGCIDDVLNDPEIDIVVELFGGIDFPREIVSRALKNGKSVVTANKDLLAEHGKELYRLAEENHADLLFEASVGGGIPIIRPLKQCLAANKISAVYGIINGTTNYMLTKMSNEHCEYASVLAEAQEKGYAEADPTSDVGGFDAARKLAILASIAFNTRITLDKVFVEGITEISARDIEYARELGYVVKLLAIAKEVDNEVEVRVHPTFIPTTHPLASVNDVFNAIFVQGDAVGDTMFYGRGAGELPTASAVAGDVMDAARNILAGVQGRIGCTCYEEKKIKDIGDTVSKYYVRLKVLDRPGVLAAIATIFGNQEVSLASVIQKRSLGHLAEIVWLTHPVPEKNIQDALKILDGMSIVDNISNVIRVEGEE